MGMDWENVSSSPRIVDMGSMDDDMDMHGCYDDDDNDDDGDYDDNDDMDEHGWIDMVDVKQIWCQIYISAVHG